MKIKRITSIFLIVIMAFTFTSCLAVRCDYPFEQNIDNVVSVEIRGIHSWTEKTTYLIKELEEDDAIAILNDLSNVKCQELYDESDTCGPVVVYITYDNGESEAIGYLSSAHISEDGVWTMKYYYYDATQFAKIVCRYVDSRRVPDLAKLLPKETFSPIITEP